MDVVGGLALADGSTAKALTGVDDHSRCRPAGSSMTTRPGPGRRCRPAVLKALDTSSSAWPGWRDAGRSHRRVRIRAFMAGEPSPELGRGLT
jgi:hypothetical protein